MDDIMSSLGVMMALKEIARRSGSKRRKRIDNLEDMPQVEMFPKYCGSEMRRLDSSEQLTLTTTRRGLLRIEVHPRRRWKWWGQRGWLVVLHLLHEQDDTWRCSRFFTNFQELCARLGIDEDDPVWQCKVQPPPARAGTSTRAEDSGWVPFCMF